MKIIYTNLQENDAGIIRSVRQLRVDFDGSGKGEARLAHGGEGDRAGRDDSLLLSHAGSSDLRRLPKGAGHSSCEGREGDRERRKDPRGNTSPALGDATSVAHLLVRRFVEAQVRSAGSFERRSRINITV